MVFLLRFFIVEFMSRIWSLAPSFFLLSPLFADNPDRVTGDWRGMRSHLIEKGVTVEAALYLDDTWNLDGGEKKSPWYGDYEYLFDLTMTIKSEPFFHYKGGTLYAEFASHNWKTPSFTTIRAFIPVDYIESAPFNSLYALWYKQQIGEKFWFLVGKSDAYDNFTVAAHTIIFLNSGYSTIPTILFFPSYPDPAMSVIASLSFSKNFSFTAGLFDGSQAVGVHPGKLGLFGKFFDDLGHHAFWIEELDLTWNPSETYSGRLGIGAWQNSAKFTKFGGGTKKGAAGPYFTLDQTLYKTSKLEGGFFFLYGSANPSISIAQRYYGVGFSTSGSLLAKKDAFGIGMSRVDFTHSKAIGFTKSYEASYEICYQLFFGDYGYLEPDFQYVVNPGGRGLPNASVFTMRLLFNL